MTSTAATMPTEPQLAPSDSAASSSSPSEAAMVAALKRKLIEQDAALKSANGRVEELETTLTMEKREHQLTTSKLSQLLKKRGTAPSVDTEKEVAALKQHMTLLQQQLLLAGERESKLTHQLSASLAQYQQLRLCKLEELEAARAMNAIQSSPKVGSRKRPLPTDTNTADSGAAAELPVPTADGAAAGASAPAAAAPATARTTAQTAADAAPPVAAATVPVGTAVSADAIKDRLTASVPAASQLRVPADPARQITPPDAPSFCSSPMWVHRMAPHAEPRVGMPRSVSHDGNLSKDSASSTRRGLSMGQPTADAAAPAATPVPTPGASPRASNAQGMRTPFGYVKGAICVEPPKRQRTGGSSGPPKSSAPPVVQANPAPA